MNGPCRMRSAAPFPTISTTDTVATHRHRRGPLPPRPHQLNLFPRAPLAVVPLTCGESPRTVISTKCDQRAIHCGRTKEPPRRPHRRGGRPRVCVGVVHLMGNHFQNTYPLRPYAFVRGFWIRCVLGASEGPRSQPTKTHPPTQNRARPTSQLFIAADESISRFLSWNRQVTSTDACCRAPSCPPRTNSLPCAAAAAQPRRPTAMSWRSVHSPVEGSNLASERHRVSADETQQGECGGGESRTLRVESFFLCVSKDTTVVCVAAARHVCLLVCGHARESSSFDAPPSPQPAPAVGFR